MNYFFFILLLEQFAYLVQCSDVQYSNHWMVKLSTGHQVLAEQIFEEGFNIFHQVNLVADLFFITNPNLSEISDSPNHDITLKLSKIKKVRWVEQQTAAHFNLKTLGTAANGISSIFPRILSKVSAAAFNNSFAIPPSQNPFQKLTKAQTANMKAFSSNFNNIGGEQALKISSGFKFRSAPTVVSSQLSIDRSFIRNSSVDGGSLLPRVPLLGKHRSVIKTNYTSLNPPLKFINNNLKFILNSRPTSFQSLAAFPEKNSKTSKVTNTTFVKIRDPLRYDPAAPKDLSCPRYRKNNERIISKYASKANDPLFPAQWYLQDCRSTESEPRHDINVIPVWAENNFGQNVVVMVIDDGVEASHPDLQHAFKADFGYDIYSGKASPYPVHGLFLNNHGTKCAGVIAMQKDNKICGVGIAPGVTLGAIRFLHGNSIMVGKFIDALTFKTENVHITSNSWGDVDDGKSLTHPTPAMYTALQVAATRGRKGKGVIHVFAAGNGKINYDTCAAEYTSNFKETIVVVAADKDGLLTNYSERCAAVMVTSYSSKTNTDPYNVASTTVGGDCTLQFGKTSAATPIISGVIALLLSANPKLNWRQVQHAIAWTSQIAPLQKNPPDIWQTNGRGFIVSEHFGFGMIDAHELVKFGKNMSSIPEMNTCTIVVMSVQPPKFNNPIPISSGGGGYRSTIISDGCAATPQEVKFLEHLYLQVTIKYSYRGALQIRLTSPSKTKIQILTARKYDTDNSTGFDRYNFDSVMSWGEDFKGKWTIEIYDKSPAALMRNRGEIREIVLQGYGTKLMPTHYSQAQGGRPYKGSYNKIHPKKLY